MNEPSMHPDELAWAFENAGRAPSQRGNSSQEFAAQARAQELELERQFLEQQRRQDLQYNEAVHRQDMQAAKAHHAALMGQYSLVDRIQGELLGDFDLGPFGWKHGFVVGLAVGALAVAVFGSWGKP